MNTLPISGAQGTDEHFLTTCLFGLPPLEGENYVHLGSMYSNFEASLSHINPEEKVRMTKMNPISVPCALYHPSTW